MYFYNLVWRAKEVFDQEGVSDPGHAIPGNKMARLLLLFLSLTWNLNGGELHEIGWDYDVCLQSEEELIMHTVDVFHERGIFSRFSISMTTFVNFVKIHHIIVITMRLMSCMCAIC